MKRIIILLALLEGWVFSFPQNEPASFKFRGLQAQYGNILAHSDAIREVSYTNPVGIIAEAGRMNTSYKSWSVFSSYWIHGFQAGYYNFRNPDIVGSAFILTAFAEPLLMKGKNFCFTLRAGAGLSYHTRIYDENENPLNKFFCTRIAVPVYLAAGFKYMVKPDLYLTLSGFYNHISNGGIKQPNYGMNFPCISIGLGRTDIPEFLEKRSYSEEMREGVKGWYHTARLITAYKVTDASDGFPEKGALVSGFSIATFRRLGMHYAVGAGAEYINDRALREELSRENIASDHKRAAVAIAQDFHFGRVVFSQHFGIYVYSPAKALDPFYQMYNLGVRVHPRLMAGIMMKAHGQNADFMGAGLSFIAGRTE